MMLPFLDPEDDIYINLSIVLIIIKTLGKTSRGTLDKKATQLRLSEKISVRLRGLLD